jgi:competence protein ComEC
VLTGWSVSLLIALGLVVFGLVVLGCHRSLVLAAAVLLVAGAALGERAWAHAEPRAVGPFVGWATLITDPTPVGRGVAVVLEIDGERFQTYAYGSARRRLERRQAGESVAVVGRRTSLAADDRRARVRHVVGRFEIDRVAESAVGAPVARASNRLRGRLRASAEASMSADDAALFTGLVVGDDARQSPEVIDRFRAVGLSHLTAVSGQNVAFTLAVAGLFLKRLSRWWRLGATWALIAWFVVLTRVEPSVVRAGTMAGLGALAFALGRDRSVPRILAITVTALVLVDPLLVWSVGFWLSCGATAGVSVVGPWLSGRWRGPGWLAEPVSATVGAQVGVALPSLLVFGRMPTLGIVTNLLAVPVAGFVMLAGIPSALIASMLPSWLTAPVMAPAALGTRWVATVAAVAEQVTPTGLWAGGMWALQAVVAWWWWRRPGTMVDP